MADKRPRRWAPSAWMVVLAALLPLVLLGSLAAATTLTAMNRQQSAAAAVNLAGRFRMLSQLVVKEAALASAGYPQASGRPGADAAELQAGLGVLAQGGRIAYAGAAVDFSPPTDPRLDRLVGEAEAAWSRLLDSLAAPSRDLGEVDRLAAAVLESADSITLYSQDSAERRTHALLWTQAGFLAAGAGTVALAALLVLRLLVGPLRRLPGASYRIAMGDLATPVPPEGAVRELAELAATMEAMRSSISQGQKVQESLLALYRRLEGVEEPEAVAREAAAVIEGFLRGRDPDG